jgi:hypothetical protein
MKEFFIRLTDGSQFGNCVVYKAIFEYLLREGIVDRIYYSVQNTYRPNYPESFHQQMKENIEFLFGNPNIVRIEKIDEIDLDMDTLSKKFNIAKRLPLQTDMYNQDTPVIPGDYITLNMKTSVHEMDKLFLQELIDVLQKSKYPVVLMGERMLSPCREYTILTDVTSIYSSINHKLPNTIDLTYEETVNQNDHALVMRNANIYQHAKYNIAMNSSGALGFISLFGNVIALTSGYSVYERMLDIPNTRFFFQKKDFLTHLRLIIH